MSKKKRYAQVGLGGRHLLWRNSVLDSHSEYCELVGLCDINEGRLRLAQRQVEEKSEQRIPGYGGEEFDRMIEETRPDCVIVTTIDRTHDFFICRAMELGCDVITEKPITIDENRCQRILDTQKRTGREIRVTFNYRYSPPRTQIKELLMSGLIGEILSVDFHWMLDTRHGADYFRRWHRKKENSGGLLVHKATHHFDLVNWWLSSVPDSVFAVGHLRFYKPETAERYGLVDRGERCHDCGSAGRCPFFLDLSGGKSTNGKSELAGLYLECEEYDGYYRDRCVFSGEIDIEDSMNVIVSYRSGVKMTYSLNAFSPWEGHTVAFNGTRGRIEHKCEESVYISGDGSVPGALKREGTWTRIYPHWKEAYEVDIWVAEGGHGGGDQPLVEDVFSPSPPKDKYLRTADHRAGIWSVITGAAANRSIETGEAVSIDSIITGLEMPDYPPMPDGSEPLSVPEEAVAG